MIRKQVLKEVIVSNEEFIINQIKEIVKREGVSFPEQLNKVVILYGVRRSGKSYVLFDLFKKYKERALYVDFEDERLIDFKAEDFEALKEAFLELKPHLIGKELIFLFDEVHNVKGWEKFCRRIVEREKIKVFVSGSSSKMMPMEIHTSLRGRSWAVEISPFSFRESLYLKNIEIKDRSFIYGPKKSLIKKYFSEYMRWGGFPEVLFLKSEFEKRRIIKEYLDAMFFKDLIERFNITNIHLLDALKDKLFSSFSSKFSLTAFYKQYKERIPFSKDSLFLYYRYFLESMLISEVRKFAESSYKRLRNPAKIYPVDTGICRRVTSTDLGRILENIVFLELRKRGEVFYFEEEGECDFVIKDINDKLSLCQVTFELTEENRKREINGLISACKELNKKNGLILTYDEEGSEKVDGIHINIMPVWKWLLEKNRG